MALLLWGVSVIIIFLLSLTLISYVREKRILGSNTQIPIVSPLPIEQDNGVLPREIFFFPKADEEATPQYAFIDVQTTGLSTTDGAEDWIVELSWLITDEHLNEIKRGCKRVFHDSSGTLEARRIHGITSRELQLTGIDESLVIKLFLNDVEKARTWVFHNAGFDLSILRASIRLFHPDFIPSLMQKNTFCTMTASPVERLSDHRYLSLIDLTAKLYGFPANSIKRNGIVSWRNVCLTRACFSELRVKYPNNEAFFNGLAASEYL